MMQALVLTQQSATRQKREYVKYKECRIKITIHIKLKAYPALPMCDNSD